MNRRAFVGALVGALVATRAHAQQPRRVQVIGWLSSDPEPDLFLEGFREGMRRYGYVEGQNLAIISRFGTGDPASLAGKVEEATQAKPALIVARGTAIRALRAERELPILIAISGDPSSSASRAVSRGPGGTSPARRSCRSKLPPNASIS